MPAWYSPSEKTVGRILRVAVFIVLPIMALLTMCSYSYSYQASNKPTPDVQKEVTINNNLRFFATNFLTVWFSGSERIDREQLESMVTAGVPIDLPVTPMAAQYINIADVKTLASGPDRGLYRVTANVTLTPPGSQSSTRNTYALELVRSDTSYAVSKLPELLPYKSPRVEANLDYVAETSTTSPLGEAITNFAGAYYVSSNAPSLGRFVTSNFKQDAIPDSPYTAVQIERIQSPKNLDGQGAPKNGQNVTVLVTLRGVVTNTTFNLMQVLLNVQKQDGKWVVDGIGQRTPISNVRTQNGAATTTSPAPIGGGFATPTQTDGVATQDDNTAPSTSESTQDDDPTATSESPAGN